MRWLIIFLLLTACSSTGHFITSDLKIGVSLPLTGPVQTMGEYSIRGIKLAQEYTNSSIKLIIEDDQCNPKKGLLIAEKFQIDKIKFLIGPFCASVYRAAEDNYDALGILRMYNGLGVQYSDSNLTTVFLGEVEPLTKSIAEYLNSVNVERIGIIYLDDDYGHETLLYFEKYYNGIITAKERSDLSELDFKTKLLKIKESKPDAIFVIAVGNHLLNILREIDELGIDLPIIGLRNVEDPEIVMNANGLTEGIIYPSLTDDSNSDIKQWYFDRYREKFGTDPESVSSVTFDIFIALNKAIDKCGNDVDCVSKEVNSQHYSGASGSFSIENGVGIRTVVIRRVVNGRFEKVK